MLRGGGLSGIAVVLILLFAIWTGAELGYQQGYSDGGDYASQHHLNRSAGDVAAPDTAETPPPPEKSNRYQKEDLNAQQAMARYALLMLGVSVVMAGITAFGVWYVARTLDTTRATLREARRATKAAQDAVTATKDTGEKQVQAYLVVTEGKLWLREFNGMLALSANMLIKNKGQSPASDISITYERILLSPLKSSKLGSWSAYVIDNEEETFCRDIAPDDEAVALMEFEPFATRSHAETTFRSEQSTIDINGTIHWTNEFDTPQKQSFRLHSARFVEASFNTENGNRKGQIDLRSGGRRSGNDAERIRNKYYSGNE